MRIRGSGGRRAEAHRGETALITHRLMRQRAFTGPVPFVPGFRQGVDPAIAKVAQQSHRTVLARRLE